MFGHASSILVKRKRSCSRIANRAADAILLGPQLHLARAAPVPPRERFQDLHRLRRRRRVHARLRRTNLRHPPRAGRRQQRRRQIRNEGRQAGAYEGAEVEFVDDGPGKPVGINHFIGRRPIMAFGNSDSDLQMLSGPPRARLRDSAYTSITTTTTANGRTTANPASAGWTRVWMRPRWAAGPW